VIPAEIIKKKRNRFELSSEELAFMVNGYTSGQLPDYQMSALLMATFFSGMSEVETSALTQIMLDSGQRVQFEDSGKVVDKHSTGGVGDKTSLILAPLLAACGLKVPMMSGRGLGHTGGTVDKLESIPGFRTDLSLADFKKQVDEIGCAMVSQTGEICPADKKIYGLRDVTATVESLPLICASIMSKKIAEGIGGLVLDVKYGSGAFMKTEDNAKSLAAGLTRVGEDHGLKVKFLITNMDQPLGAFVGNLVEVAECLAIMTGDDCLGAEEQSFNDCKELTIELATQMIQVSDLAMEETEARKKVIAALDSGQAFETFAKMCHLQGGNLGAIQLPTAFSTVVAESSGYIESYNTEQIGIAAIELGAGRKTLNDKINPLTGLRVHKKVGDLVEAGEPLFTLFAGKEVPEATQAKALINQSVAYSEAPIATTPLVLFRE